jgi:hypothetical protein
MSYPTKLLFGNSSARCSSASPELSGVDAAAAAAAAAAVRFHSTG